MKIIKHEKPKKELSYWANLNKNSTHDEYIEQVIEKENYSKEEVFVIETIEVSKIEFKGLQNLYLDNLPEYFTQGGHTLDKEEALKENKELTKEIEKNENIFELSGGAIKLYKKHCIRQTVKIVCKELINSNSGDGIFYVDTQGYKYARYVGISENEFNYLMYYKELQNLQEKTKLKIDKLLSENNGDYNSENYKIKSHVVYDKADKKQKNLELKYKQIN